MYSIEASLLAFDLKTTDSIISQIKKLKQYGINRIHYDVMDGIFVSNTAFNGEYLSLFNQFDMDISVHLMVNNIFKYAKKFVKYNINYLTFHIEPIVNNKDLVIEILNTIRSKNIKAGLAIRPETNISVLNPYLDYIDIITLMSVNPGMGGQSFIESSVIKAKELYELVNDRNIVIQIDGGINKDNVSMISQYCERIVSGSSLMKNIDNKIYINEFIEKTNQKY